LPRPKPPYEMMNVCIRAPANLVQDLKSRGITELSQVTVEYWRSLVGEPEDPRMKTIQTAISDYAEADPGIVKTYARDDVKGERLIMSHLNSKGIEATASEIGSVMVRLMKVK